MNFQRVAMRVAKAGAHPGGLRGLVEYNERARQDSMTQAVRYIAREGGTTHKEDLVEKGAAHLPAWAKDTVDFFSKAEQYGRQNHNPAKIIEITLPRELSPAGRRTLVNAIRDTYFSHNPHSWAIHNPPASDGGEQPHLHLIVSMRVDDGIERAPTQWFRRGNPEHPERGGAYRYDTFDWVNRTNISAFRDGVARLTNLMLEQEGFAQRVYAGTLKSLWIDREAARYLHPGVYRGRTPDARRILQEEAVRRDNAAKHQEEEQEYIQADWHKTKRIHRYDGLTIAMAVEYERGRFYQDDKTPWREHERRVHQEITKARERVQAQAYQHQEQQGETRRPPQKGMTEEQLTQRLSKPLLGNKCSKIYHIPGDHNYGDIDLRNQVQFWSHDAALAAGYRQAVNQNYGRGAVDPKEGKITKGVTKRRESGLAAGVKGMRRRRGLHGSEEASGGGLTVKLRNGWDAQDAGREW